MYQYSSKSFPISLLIRSLVCCDVLAMLRYTAASHSRHPSQTYHQLFLDPKIACTVLRANAALSQKTPRTKSVTWWSAPMLPSASQPALMRQMSYLGVCRHSARSTMISGPLVPGFPHVGLSIRRSAECSSVSDFGLWRLFMITHG